MQHYEMLCIMSLKLNEAEQAAVLGNIRELIVKEGGLITKEENWGRRRLAYEIKHEQQGDYALFEFDLAADKLSQVTVKLKLMPQLLRYAMTKKRVKTESEIAREKMIHEKVEKRAAAEKEAAELAAAPAPAIAPEPAKEKAKEPKISLEDLDKKLDEILKEEI